ncbi:phosphatase 2C-like domain-containing protein [Scheffersomyces coipomensis]|uniref:phosphatase 2C-like domain-containing protein n=1 Tax=Scheffersomyces coipomensis TaxID=1788519 RepID=UPI00315CFC41
MVNIRRFHIVIVCFLIVIVSMSLSYIAKRSSIPIGRTFGPRTALRTTRSFSFSSTSAKSTSNSASTSTSSAAASNYDNSIHTLKNYDVAVAYQPKDREESNLFKKKHNKPSPALQSPSGEDNLFVSKQFEDGYITLGVADGVGGWSEAGYDSSAISRELCASMKLKFESLNDRSQITPKQLLSLAFDDISTSPKVEIGGTTACFGIISPDKTLKVANLGDSWCGLFRNYQLINETKFQTHNFNTPYQLAKIPPQIIKQAELEGRRYIIDSPAVADEYTWDLKSDDIIMFATDGVTDNIIPKDIELFLKDQIEGKKNNLDTIAKTFVKEVVKVSKDPNFPSAFAQELSRLTGQKYLGGKADDITIVLVKVQ